MAKLSIVGKKGYINNGKVEDTDKVNGFRVHVNYTLDLEGCPEDQLIKFVLGTSAKVMLQNNTLRPMGKVALEAWQASGEVKHFTWKDCFGKGRKPATPPPPPTPDEAKAIWIAHLNTMSPEDKAKALKEITKQIK